MYTVSVCVIFLTKLVLGCYSVYKLNMKWTVTDAGKRADCVLLIASRFDMSQSHSTSRDVHVRVYIYIHNIYTKIHVSLCAG